MFILKRQDVDITNVQHPSKDQKIPILSYQEQTFRLLSVFNAAQQEEAMALWRDLTDNKGKACVLLEEPERFSVWGKVKIDQLEGVGDATDSAPTSSSVPPSFVKACLLLLQALYIDVEDLLGDKQANLFAKDIGATFNQWQFPEANSASAVNTLLTVDPLAMANIPAWQERHLTTLLQELHRLGKNYFGNANFAERALDALEDLPEGERQQFMGWLSQTPSGQLWKN